jgi:hypothetical protein
MSKYQPSFRPAKPGKVTKLNPVIVRSMHMSRDRRKTVVAFIEQTARLVYVTSTAAGSAEAGR